ncbi:MAG: NUDIX domain-containing protein [Candidatus Paceibacterota bacterium]
MPNEKKDKIIFLKDKVLHQSAGGFVFYESHTNELYVALLKNDKNKFVIPKGHIQQRESPESAALREIREEMGIRTYLKLIGFAGQSRYKFKDYEDERMHFKRVNLFVFSAQKMAKLSPEKIEGFIDAKWLKIEDALRKLAFDKKLLLKAADIYREYSHPTNSTKK